MNHCTSNITENSSKETKMWKFLGAIIFVSAIISSCDPGAPEPSTPTQSTGEKIEGCTDQMAQNYNSQADYDDCSCQYTGFTAMPTPPSTAEKNVLIEDFTGEWCGWCVDATVIIDQLRAQHPGRILVSAIHQGDFLANDFSIALINKFQPPGFPSGLVDRRITPPISRGIWESQTLLSLSNEAVVGMAVETKEKDANTIQGLVHVDFKQDLSNFKYRLHIYAIENNIPSVRQQNYYNQLAGSESHPYFNKPRILPTSEYTHHDVLRSIVGNHEITGKALSNDGVFTRKFEFNHSSFNKENIEFLVFVTDFQENNVLNVFSVKAGETLSW